MRLFTLTRRMTLLGGSAALLGACARPEKAVQDIPIEIAPSWTTGPALPLAVQEIYPCLHKGRIHLAGGLYAQDGQIAGATDRHVSWAPGETEWREETPLSVPLHHPQLISYNGALLAMGGFMVESPEAVWVMQSACYQLVSNYEKPPKEDVSQRLDIIPPETWWFRVDIPEPSGESVTSVLNENLHICGGRVPKGDQNKTWQDHTDTGNHFVLFGSDGLWDNAAPLPTPRNSAAGAVIDGQWHVVGGRTVSDGNTPAHEVYDAKEDRWRTAAPMPQGQGGLAAASLGGKLYAFGGEYFDNGGGVYPESWVYDPAADAWAAIPDMPNPRHGLGAVTIDDSIYVIGGALKVGGSETSNLIEIFTP